MPKISVIVPSYNVEKYLAEALDSVAAQTYPDWECIIVDDGSTDGTADVARSYCRKDSRFTLVSQENRGLSGARNAGVANASGEFLLPLDADDRIAPRYMELAMKVFEERPETKLVYGGARLFGDKNEPWKLPEYNYELFLSGNCIYCTSFFRRSDAVAAGLYDETFRSGYEDWDFLLRLLRADSVVFKIPQVMFYYRQHRNGSLLTAAVGNEEQLIKRIVAKYPQIYKPYQDKVALLMRPYMQMEAYKAEKAKKKERGLSAFFKKTFKK